MNFIITGTLKTRRLVYWRAGASQSSRTAGSVWRMQGIVGERERSNCVVDMICIQLPEKQAGYRRYMHMEYEERSMKYKACSRDMHME